MYTIVLQVRLVCDVKSYPVKLIEKVFGSCSFFRTVNAILLVNTSCMFTGEERHHVEILPNTWLQHNTNDRFVLNFFH